MIKSLNKNKVVAVEVILFLTSKNPHSIFSQIIKAKHAKLIYSAILPNALFMVIL